MVFRKENRPAANREKVRGPTDDNLINDQAGSKWFLRSSEVAIPTWTMKREA